MARNNVTFDDLLMIARRCGVEVIAAPSSHRGQLGKMGTVVGCVRHHTGTPETFKPTEDYPTYQVVKEGRAGLENSLSAFGLGRNKAIYVFSEYLSWHAGAWSYAGITDGNGHFLGIEAEGTGGWTKWQQKIYPRLCASILLFLGEGVDMMPRHADGAMPRGRKTDAANLWPTFTAEVQNYLDHPEQLSASDTPATSEEDDMKLFCIRSDPKQWDQDGRVGNGEIALWCPGLWWPVQNMDLLAGYQAHGVAAPMVHVPPNWYGHYRDMANRSEANDEQIKALVQTLAAAEAARVVTQPAA